MLIGTMINCGFYGVFCVQVHTYSLTFSDDRMIFKILVYGCFVVETFQTILITRDGFDLFVTDLGNPLAIDQARFYWASTAVTGGIIAAVGQIFFAYRLRVISKTWIFPITVVLLALCATAAQFVIAVRLYVSGKISSVFEDAFIPSLVAFITSMICDVEIAVAIVYYLSRHHPIFNSRLYHQVKQLIRLMVETGVLIAATNTLSFILYILFKHSTYFVVSYMMISKLYSNTLLLILNNRLTITGGRSDVDQNHGIVMWNTNSAPNLYIQSRSNRGLADPPSPTNDTLVLREIWRSNTNSDNDEVVYTANDFHAT
ncbi:hypothetical protein BDZ94DRAFT_737716 [Collybia nuda]|uniref:DUF6534 domain-containing protein n=1 Tax=Collybia nuda TaxID=64659 RepID=A0A9P5Y4Z9_9AGAR|nr:hypothetical protein BDZ94DRAFT_737716 [Collybia nuda]